MFDCDTDVDHPYTPRIPKSSFLPTEIQICFAPFSFEKESAGQWRRRLVKEALAAPANVPATTLSFEASATPAVRQQQASSVLTLGTV